MATQPIFESLNILKSVGKVKTTVKAECKTETATEGIKRVIGISAAANITDKETEVGKIKCGGKIVYQVFYETEDGEIKKCEASCEYAGVITDDKITERTISKLEVKVEKTEADITGTKLTLSAILIVTGELFINETVSALTGGENLITLNKETEIIKSYGVKTGTYSIEEEFEIPFEIKEVLSHKAEPRITAAQCGVGTIIVDGEVVLSALLLQNSENSDIIRETKTLPFRMELDYEEAMPSMQCSATVFEKSFKSDVTVEEGGGKSIVTASVFMQFESEATAIEEVTLAEDVFSTAEELEVTAETVLYDAPCAVIGCSAEVLEKVPLTDIAEGTILTAVGGERAELLEVKPTDGGLKIEGTLRLDLYLKDAEGKKTVKRIETPFNAEAACVIPEDCGFTVRSVVANPNAKLLSLEEAEVGAEILLSVYTNKSKKLKYIKEVSVSGEKTPETSAVSVYIPTEGEEMWSLAKRLNVSPEELLRANKDLQFPLSGEERIVVYRQRQN